MPLRIFCCFALIITIRQKQRSKKRKALVVLPIMQVLINEAEFRFLASGCCTKVPPPSKKRKAEAVQPIMQAQINEAEFRFLASGCCTRVPPPSKKRKALVVQPIYQARGLHHCGNGVYKITYLAYCFFHILFSF